MNRSFTLALAVTSLAVLTFPSHGQNLILNGDFEDGNTGFFTDYEYRDGGLIGAGLYTVNTDPANHHSGWDSYGDHTSGAGNMLIVNGSTAADWVVWGQEVAVEPNTWYQFSYWAALSHPASPPELRATANGGEIDVFDPSEFQETGVWYEVSCDWYSEDSALVTLELTDLNIESDGNDFAIDDIDLRPHGLMLTAEGACPGFVNVTLSGATRGDFLVIVYGLRPGETEVLPHCPGLFLGIHRPKVVVSGVAGECGCLDAFGYVPDAGCGRVLLQGLNLTTCENTDVFLIQ